VPSDRHRTSAQCRARTCARREGPRRKWSKGVAICVLASFLFAGCGSATKSTASTAHSPASTAAASHSQPTATKAQTIDGYQAIDATVSTATGGTRSYIVFPPPSGAKQSPLVLVYHGALATAEGTVQETDFVQLAQKDGYVVAFLQGYGDTWNEGAGNTPAHAAGVNDVEFTSAVLSQIESRYSIDRTRVAAAGFSNGALLADLLGCQLAGKLTLIAPVAGPLPVSVSPTCRPARPISVLAFHGTADQSIPYGGGHFEGIGGGTTVLSAPESAARWAALDHCSHSRQSTESALATVLTTYSLCRQHVVVQLRSLQGAGHGWPSDVGVLVAEFLHQHPRAVAK
jgi:polyhydroxybutyrate depolymerase